MASATAAGGAGGRSARVTDSSLAMPSWGAGSSRPVAGPVTLSGPPSGSGPGAGSSPAGAGGADEAGAGGVVPSPGAGVVRAAPAPASASGRTGAAPAPGAVGMAGSGERSCGGALSVEK